VSVGLGCLNVVVICAGLLSGCSTFRKKADIGYETVASSPGHDTELAIKEHDKALKILQKASKSKPSDSDLAKAENHLQRALTADANFGPAHNTLGTVYFMQRKLYLAAWEYQYALKLMPERAEPLSNLGLVYENASNLQQAIMYYELSYEIDPQNPHIIGNLARALIRSGESSDRINALLQDLLMYDLRSEWVAWAKEILVMNPVIITSNEDSFDQEAKSNNEAPKSQFQQRFSDSAENIPEPSSERDDLPTPKSRRLHPDSDVILEAPVIPAPILN